MIKNLIKGLDKYCLLNPYILFEEIKKNVLIY